MNGVGGIGGTAPNGPGVRIMKTRSAGVPIMNGPAPNASVVISALLVLPSRT